MTKAYDNSLLARNISISGVNTNVSGVLQVNSVDVSVSGHAHVIGDVTGLQSALDGKQASGSYAAASHTHTASDITDFNSSVSGLLPVTNIIAGSNISVSSASGAYTINSVPSKSLQIFTARDNNPPATNFATLDTRNSVLVLEFDAATEESATFIGAIPENAALPSGLTVLLWWMGDTATSGNVRWGVQFEKTGSDLDTDSYDTDLQVTSAASGTSGIESVASITITTIDSLAAGDRFRLRVYRVAADATNDTMTGDAQLVAVEVRAA